MRFTISNLSFFAVLLLGQTIFGQSTQTIYYDSFGLSVSPAYPYEYYDVLQSQGTDSVYVESFYPNGSKRSTGVFLFYGSMRQQQDGEHISYHQGTDQPKAITQFDKGGLQQRTTYYASGKLRRTEHYNADGEMTEGHCYLPDGSERGFIPYEVPPVYIDGKEAMYVTLLEALKYPAKARATGVQGTVIMALMIEKDGSISDSKIIQGIGGGCDEEMLRVAPLLQRFIPATVDGVPTRQRFDIPMEFKL